jgi:hypothetical protein
LVGNVASEVLHRSRDAIVTPIAILASHTDDQVRDLSADSRPVPDRRGVWNRQTSGQSACGTNPGWSPVSPLRRPPAAPYVRVVCDRASVARCGLVNRSRAGKCERRIRFSAIRYSFCSRSCWFTIPVTYANSPRYLRFLHPNARSYSSSVFNAFELFDHTATT